jgi:hypothetical protein
MSRIDSLSRKISEVMKDVMTLPVRAYTQLIPTANFIALYTIGLVVEVYTVDCWARAGNKAQTNSIPIAASDAWSREVLNRSCPSEIAFRELVITHDIKKPITPP